MLRHTHPSRATGPSVIYDTRSFPHEPRRAPKPPPPTCVPRRSSPSGVRVSDQARRETGRRRRLGTSGHSSIRRAPTDTINYRTTPDWAGHVLELTDSQGVDVVLDVVEGDGLRDSVRAAKRNGLVAVIGFLKGQTTNLDLMDLNLAPDPPPRDRRRPPRRLRNWPKAHSETSSSTSPDPGCSAPKPGGWPPRLTGATWCQYQLMP